MAVLVIAGCVLVAVLSTVGVAYPQVLVGVIRALYETPSGLYAAAGIRVVFGAALFIAAPTSRAPRTLRVLGAISVVVGLAMPVVGVEGFSSRVEVFSALDPGFLRIYAVFVLTVSALLAYALVPRSRAAQQAAAPDERQSSRHG